MIRKYLIRILEIFLAFLIRVIIRLFAKIKITGLTHLKISESFILACNHVSFIDPPLICAFTLPVFKRCLMPAATRGLFVFPLSFVLWVVQAIPINREQSHLNLNSMKQMIRVLKSQERNLLIFPQGGIPDENEFHRVRGGIGLLALKSRAPVIPASIQGTPDVFSKGRNWLKRPEIQIRFGTPISFDTFKNEEKLSSRKEHQEAALSIMKAIIQLGE